MRLTLKLTTENQGTETVRLGSQVVEKAKDAVAGMNDGRISYDDARDIIVTAASTGFSGGALSDDELKFLEFLAGPGAAKRINIVTTGEELAVRVTEGKRSGTSALSRGSAPWTAAKALILKGVEDRGYAEFGRERKKKIKATPHRVVIDSPQKLEAMLNELMAEESSAIPGQPRSFGPVRVNHDATKPFTGAVVTTEMADLHNNPGMARDRESFSGSQTEAQLARAIKVLGGDDWMVTNYTASDNYETAEVGAMIYSADQGLAIRFAYWKTN